MAIQFDLTTIRGSGAAKFRSLKLHQKRNAVSWGVLVDSFDLKFGLAPLTGAHDVRSILARVDAVRFDENVEAVVKSGLENDAADRSSSKVGLLGFLCDDSDDSHLYLYNDGPRKPGDYSHDLPGSADWAAAALAGYEVQYPASMSDHQVMSFSASVSSPLPLTTTTSLSYSNSANIGDDSGNSGSGSVSCLSIAAPAGLNIPPPFVSNWQVGWGQISAEFPGLDSPTGSAVILPTGLNLSYGDDDHQVARIHFSAGNETSVINWDKDQNGKYTAKVTWIPQMEIEDTVGNVASSDSVANFLVLLLPSGANS